MKSELIVDVQPQEIAIALTEDDRLQEVAREKRDQDNFAVGNIYYGRVKKVMPALNAVFVDVGYEKEAFLHYLDLGSQFRTLQTYVTKAVSDKRRVPLIQKTPRQPEVGKEGQIAEVLIERSRAYVALISQASEVGFTRVFALVESSITILPETLTHLSNVYPP